MKKANAWVKPGIGTALFLVLSIVNVCSQPCTLTCPNYIFKETDPGVCGAVVNFTIGLGDCASYTLEPNLPSGSLFPAGETILTVTSNEGTTCSFSIWVEDTEEPVFSPCPADIIVTLDPGACSALVNYIVGADDNCEIESVVQAAGLPPGSEFPIGTTMNYFVAVDIFGNVSDCYFDVTILEYPNPSATLACNDNIQISLDEDGCVDVLADMILEGGPYGCYDDYLVEILDELGNPIGNEVCCEDRGQTLTVRVTALETGNKCWGTITVMDKLKPEMQCLDITLTIPVGNVYYLTPGEVDGGSLDNCGINNLSLSQEEFTCADAGQHPITLTATDFSGNTATCEANITVFTDDTAPPSINCPSDIIITLNPGLCFAFVNYNVSASDNCATDPIIEQSEGLPAGSGFPIGTTVNCFLVVDQSGNSSSCCFNVMVNEFPNPTATLACNDNVPIFLDEDGCVEIGADQILEGGPYGCYDDYLVEILDEFGNPIGNEVCCQDVGQTSAVRVTDPETGNKCWGTIVPEDGLPPAIIFCPPGQSINCDTYRENYADAISQGDYSVLDPFGEPQFSDNCSFTLTLESNVAISLNNCAVGAITRSWTASDGYGNQTTCTQFIQVTHLSDWVVEFPEDIIAQCINGQLPDTGEPQIFFDECELIGVSHSDQLFTNVPDACYYIVRKWTVINWCIYDDFGGVNIYSEAGKAEVNLNVDWDGDGDQDCRTFRDGWNSTGSPGTPDGYITHKQTIKVVIDEDPLFTVDADGCIVEEDCNKTLTLPYPTITDYCSPWFDVDITGDFGTFNNIAGDVTIPNVSVGDYEVTYAVTGRCGQTGYLTITVEVEDCKLPTPLCKTGLTFDIPQSGILLLNASQLDNGSFDNCGPIANYSFSPDVNNTALLFTQDDAGFYLLQLWVTDIYGNQDFCETQIEIPGNGNVGPEIGILDPCSCLDNATTLSNGQFGETVEVNSSPGEVWTVVTAPGLYQAVGPDPPAPPPPVAAGTPMVEISPGKYRLAGRHVDAQGYSISVTNSAATLGISNTCYYPNPVLSGLEAYYCSQDGPQNATVTAQLGDGSGEASVESILFELIFQPDGNVVDMQAGGSQSFSFDPAALANGLYALRVTFDAGGDGSGHPGCVQTIEEVFEVRKVGCGSFPWNGN